MHASGACRWIALLALVGSACSEPASPRAAGGRKPTRSETPACASGTFAGELDALMPPLTERAPVALYPATSIDKTIEPGCVVPFHDKPGDEAIDVGAVIVTTTVRDDPRAKPIQIGRGRLQVGRAALHLTVQNDAGDEVLTIDVDGTHASLRRKGMPAFDAEIDLSAVDPLPLPLDALVASISRCDADERLLASVDGNVVSARRSGASLWRTRWLDGGSSMAVDTSVACGEGDARFAWRSVAGDALPMLSVASVRSKETLVVMKQGAAMTEDWADPGMGSGAR